VNDYCDAQYLLQYYLMCINVDVDATGCKLL